MPLAEEIKKKAKEIQDHDALCKANTDIRVKLERDLEPIKKKFGDFVGRGLDVLEADPEHPFQVLLKTVNGLGSLCRDLRAKPLLGTHIATLAIAGLLVGAYFIR